MAENVKEMPVINPALKGGAFGRTTWDTQSNPFRASQGAQLRRPLHTQSRAIRTGNQNLRSIEVSMVLVATRGAVEGGLRATRLGVDAAACAARLRTVRGWHLDEGAARPREFVAEHVREAGPSRVRDAASAATSNHPRNVQLLQNDDAVALGESCRLDVQEVVALPPHLAVDASDADLGLLSVLRSFLPSADGALCVGESLERGFEVTWAGDHLAVGSGAEVRDAAVDCHDWPFAQSGLGEGPVRRQC